MNKYIYLLLMAALVSNPTTQLIAADAIPHEEGTSASASSVPSFTKEAIFDAAESGDLGFFKGLEPGAVDLDVTRVGSTPALVAMQNGRENVVLRLLDLGANPNAYEHGGLFAYAIRRGSGVEFLETLRSKGVDPYLNPVATDHRIFHDPLWVGAIHAVQSEEVAAYLCKNFSGETNYDHELIGTALLASVKFCKDRSRAVIMKALLTHMSSDYLNYRNAMGETALGECARTDNLEDVRILTASSKVNVNAPVYDRFTEQYFSPLGVALGLMPTDGHKDLTRAVVWEVVGTLLRAGATLTEAEEALFAATVPAEFKEKFDKAVKNVRWERRAQLIMFRFLEDASWG